MFVREEKKKGGEQCHLKDWSRVKKFINMNIQEVQSRFYFMIIIKLNIQE